MKHVVRISWQRTFDNKQMWNSATAWATEYFGLPGSRWAGRANVEYMEFVFVDPKDALIMSLRWNARIVTEDEIVVEFVGSRL
jgi:hypothetical protein